MTRPCRGSCVAWPNWPILYKYRHRQKFCISIYTPNYLGVDTHTYIYVYTYIHMCIALGIYIYVNNLYIYILYKYEMYFRVLYTHKHERWPHIEIFTIPFFGIRCGVSHAKILPAGRRALLSTRGSCHRAPQCPWHLVSTPKALLGRSQAVGYPGGGWYPLLQQLFAKRFEISKFCMNPIDSNGITSYEILRQVATSRWRANSSYLGTVGGQSRERYKKMEQDATNWDNQHHFCVTFCRRKCFRYLEINHITDLDRYITQYPPSKR